MLDEPTVGVDPQSRNLIFDGIEDLKRQERRSSTRRHYMKKPNACATDFDYRSWKNPPLDGVESSSRPRRSSVIEAELERVPMIRPPAGRWTGRVADRHAAPLKTGSARRLNCNSPNCASTPQPGNGFLNLREGAFGLMKKNLDGGRKDLLILFRDKGSLFWWSLSVVMGLLLGAIFSGTGRPIPGCRSPP